MNAVESMTRADAAAYIAGLSLMEKRQLAAFLRITQDPATRPRLLDYLQQQGLLESFLEAERGGPATEKGDPNERYQR